MGDTTNTVDGPNPFAPRNETIVQTMFVPGSRESFRWVSDFDGAKRIPSIHSPSDPVTPLWGLARA